eukprot:1255948-Pleurochrysis_carterae.AAC.1
MLLSLGALVLLPALALVDALLLRHPLGQPAQHPVRSAESPALVGNWAAVKSISYLHAARSPLPRLCADELQFIVRRTENGLGIVVDENNVVASCPGQPELRIGDQIVAVDEQRLSGHVSKALTPGPQSSRLRLLAYTSCRILLSPIVPGQICLAPGTPIIYKSMWLDVL